MKSVSGWPGLLSAALLVLIVGLIVVAQSAATKSRPSDTVACVTLEAAAAHGYLDDAGYRRVVRALTSDGNPYRDEFPANYRAFMAACAALRATHAPKLAADGRSRLADRK